MPIYGYIFVNGEKWLVEMNILSTRRALKRRSFGSEGVYLDEVQELLELPMTRMYVDQLDDGYWVYLPLAKLDLLSHQRLT